MKFIFSLIILIVFFSFKTHADQVDKEYWQSKDLLEKIIHFDQDHFLDSLDTVEIVSVKKLIFIKSNGKFKLTFYKNFAFFQVDAKVNGVARSYVFAANSARTFYRIYGFVMNDIMSLCTDIKADIDYLIKIAKQNKIKTFITTQKDETKLADVIKNVSNYSFNVLELKTTINEF